MNYADLSGDGSEAKGLRDSKTMATTTTKEHFAVSADVNVDAAELPHPPKFSCRQVSAARCKVLNQRVQMPVPVVYVINVSTFVMVAALADQPKHVVVRACFLPGDVL